MKKAILLVPHRPHLDPRIDWVATTAGKYFDLTVIGVDSGITKKESCRANGYEEVIIPLQRNVKTMKDCIRFVKHIGRREKTECGGAEQTVRIPDNKFKNYLEWRWIFFETQATMLDYLFRTRSNVDMIICADLHTLRVGRIIKQKTGCKLIYDAHEFYSFAYEALKIQKRFLYNQEKKEIKSADAVFTVNNYLAKFMEKKLGYSPIWGVPNAAPLERILDFQDEVSRYNGEKIKFLFQGGFANGRGLEFLIEAWDKVDKRAVLFIRGPHNSYKDYLISLADKRGINGNRLFFVDSIDESHLIAAARNADVGIIPYIGSVPNNKLACPNKLSQFMQAGIAILTNNLTFVRDKIKRYENGMWYDSSDPDSFVKAVSLLCDQATLEKYKQNSLKYARSEYNWEKQSEKMREVFEKFSS